MLISTCVVIKENRLKTHKRIIKNSILPLQCNTCPVNVLATDFLLVSSVETVWTVVEITPCGPHPKADSSVLEQEINGQNGWSCHQRVIFPSPLDRLLLKLCLIWAHCIFAFLPNREEDFKRDDYKPSEHEPASCAAKFAAMLEEDMEVAIKVVVVGNGAVGKSSMIQRYCKGIFTKDYKKTIGVDFLERQIM